MNFLRFKLILLATLVAGLPLRGQVPTTAAAGIEAAFEPPLVQLGEKVFYRVTVAAAAAAIQWPDRFHTPVVLKLEGQARGEILGAVNGQMTPQTTFLYAAVALMPGNITIPPFVIGVNGQRVVVPAATLTVVEDNSISSHPPRQILLEIPRTNYYIGETFVARLLLPAGISNQIDALREVQFNGEGFLAGKTSLRIAVEPVERAGRKLPAYVQEMSLTPIATGNLMLSAQGFTAGREFPGAITITGGATGPVILGGGPARYVLVVSEPVQIKVRPLPEDGRLPGFTGGIGKFMCDLPQLSTNRIRVGEPLLLKAAVRGETGAVKLTPPAPPRLKDWEIIPEHQPGIAFTLIPLTDEPRATPAIPFSCFDPETGKYVNLTIPPVPLTIISDGLPVVLVPADEAPAETVPAQLTGLAPHPGKTMASLKPWQLRPWFVGLQLLPVIGFMALWQWDRRRRFLAAHPEIVRRRQARRALRREKVKLRKAAEAGDAAAFVQHAAAAMRIACAPHFPAHPRALVCADVLVILAGERERDTARRILEVDDAQFSATPAIHAGLLALQNDVAAVLQKLEEQL